MYFQDIFAILVSADGTDSSDVQVCQVRLALMRVPSTDEVLPCLLQTFKMQKFSKRIKSAFLLLNYLIRF